MLENTEMSAPKKGANYLAKRDKQKIIRAFNGILNGKTTQSTI